MALAPINTRKGDTVDDYHGTPIADPYRWLEDPADPEVVAWTEAQNRRTRGFLDAIPARERLRERLTKLWDYPRWTIPQKESGRAFFLKNDGLQNQAVLYVAPTPDAEPVELLDPNTLSEDGTVALTNISPSDDGLLLGYALSEAGSDWQRLLVRDVDERDDLPDVIRWCKFSPIAWTRDSSGFFYARFPEPGTVAPEDTNNFNRVYYHRLGDTQAQDTLIYERPDEKELHFHPTVTHDGRYLVITRRPRHRPTRPHLLHGDRRRRQRHPADRRGRRQVRVHRQRRPGLPLPDRPRRPTRAASSRSTPASRSASTGAS